MSKLFIGHTRFSVHQYKSGSFKATRQGDAGLFTEEEYTAWLYDEARLGPRTEIFIEESLPQLAASADVCDVVHIVHYSSSLPQKYQDILRQAAEKYPFLHLNEAPGLVAPSAPNKKVLNTVLRGRLPEDGVFGIYRLDDDDVLPINFFERMNPYLVEEHVGWRISFPESLTAIRTRSEYILPWRRYFPKAAAGLLSIHQKTAEGTFLGMHDSSLSKGHMKLDTAYPTVLDSREPGFFQARHVSQDSTLGDGASPFFGELIPSAAKKEPVSVELLDEYFPFVSRRIRRDLAQRSDVLELDGATALGPDAEVTVNLQSDHAQLLLAEISGEDLPSPTVSVELTVARDEGLSDTSVKTYLEAAGLHRVGPDLYRGSLTFGRHSEYGHLVLETPDGSTVTSVRFSSTDPLELKSLRSYRLA
ncbi:glycosyltransferase [Nesterenkonia sandarakina]|uniref:Putative rhamnosyltransferase n=1 Tax=Nesterenkonia sandarakina TaxID=272918 RepID=A0A2T0YTI4_9MICC|nr:glycosyltransferase [Nesterenkonia sandarakina]PRZ18891.1 putative rhamnosyltransferase [Nesterenkonia sandarakina]